MHTPSSVPTAAVPTGRRSARSMGLRLAILGVSSGLVLSACATSGDGGEGGGGGIITYAYEQEFSAYNNNQAEANSTANSIVLTNVLGHFVHVNREGEPEADTALGTYEKTSDDPLTVKYTINEDAKWSDGEPITAKDWYLSWAAASDNYSDFQIVSTTGTEDTEKPTEAADAKEFEVKYTKPFADWEYSAFSPEGMQLLPAHVVERETGVDVADAVKKDDEAAMKKVAEFWNTKWSGFAPGQLPDESLIPSSGPYKIGSWEAGQKLSLVPNDQYWGDKPKNDGIDIRFIPQEAQVQALRNGDADVIEPQPNVDLINAVNGLGDQASYETSDSFIYDHIDFNNEGVFKNKDLREAIANCVPRQEIVDRLIKPVNDEAKVLNLSNVMTFQPGYDDMVDKTRAKDFESVNIDKAKELVKKSGVTDLKIRGAYLGNPNQRRADTWKLIEESCSKAGFSFDVKSYTPQEWGKEVIAGNFDMALFAWAGSGQISAIPPLYKTGSDQNYMRYSSPEVDKILDRLVRETDSDKQDELKGKLQQKLWEDLPTLPLFVHPILEAHSSAIEGVKINPTQTQTPVDNYNWERR